MPKNSWLICVISTVVFTAMIAIYDRDLSCGGISCCEKCDVIDEFEREDVVGILDDVGYWSYEDQSTSELRDELCIILCERDEFWRLEFFR